MTKSPVTIAAILLLGAHFHFHAAAEDAAAAKDHPVPAPALATKTKEELKELFKKLDVNGDAMLSLEEFSKVSAEPKKEAAAPAKANPGKETATAPAAGPKGDPDATFKLLDRNHDGKMTLEELKTMNHFKKNPDTAERSFKKRDLNGDNWLSLEEFKSMGHVTSMEDED